MTLNARIGRLTLQPSITYLNKFIELSVSSRIANLKFSNINGHFHDLDTDLGNLLRSNPNYVLFDLH